MSLLETRANLRVCLVCFCVLPGARCLLPAWPRTKGGVVSRRRRNRVLKQAKGFFGSKHCLYKVANQQVMKSLVYAYRDRKNNKRNFRKLWIVRINAASRALGLSYNQLMHGLKLANVDINRKMLADLAVNDAAMFENLCTTAKNALAK